MAGRVHADDITGRFVNVRMCCAFSAFGNVRADTCGSGRAVPVHMPAGEDGWAACTQSMFVWCMHIRLILCL